MDYSHEELKEIAFDYLGIPYKKYSSKEIIPGKNAFENAESKLQYMVIEGEDLLYVLDEIKEHYTNWASELEEKVKINEENTNKINNYRERIHKLINHIRKQKEDSNNTIISDLEEIVRNKEGPFVTKIKEVITEYKTSPSTQ